MTVGAATPLAQVAACLQAGGVAVLFVPVDGGVVAARDAVRACCADVLTGLTAAHGLSAHASRSATPGLGALALSRSAGVGIDVERLRPELLDDDLLELALHADERLRHEAAAAGSGPRSAAAARRFFDVWTRKEAVMKALGLGLALAPASFDAGAPTADWRPVRTPAGAGRVRSVDVARRAGCSAGSRADSSADFSAAVAVTAVHAMADVCTFWAADHGTASSSPPVSRQQRARRAASTWVAQALTV